MSPSLIWRRCGGSSKIKPETPSRKQTSWLGGKEGKIRCKPSTVLPTPNTASHSVWFRTPDTDGVGGYFRKSGLSINADILSLTPVSLRRILSTAKPSQGQLAQAAWVQVTVAALFWRRREIQHITVSFSLFVLWGGAGEAFCGDLIGRSLMGFPCRTTRNERIRSFILLCITRKRTCQDTWEPKFSRAFERGLIS